MCSLSFCKLANGKKSPYCWLVSVLFLPQRTYPGKNQTCNKRSKRWKNRITRTQILERMDHIPTFGCWANRILTAKKDLLVTLAGARRVCPLLPPPTHRLQGAFGKRAPGLFTAAAPAGSGDSGWEHQPCSGFPRAGTGAGKHTHVPEPQIRPVSQHTNLSLHQKPRPRQRGKARLKCCCGPGTRAGHQGAAAEAPPLPAA